MVGIANRALELTIGQGDNGDGTINYIPCHLTCPFCRGVIKYSGRIPHWSVKYFEKLPPRK